MNYQVHTLQKESLIFIKVFTRIFPEMMNSLKLWYFCKDFEFSVTSWKCL